MYSIFILVLQMKKWVTKRGRILPRDIQPGFAPSRSPEAGLLAKFQTFCKTMESSKPFASVPHPEWLFQFSGWIQFSAS